MLPPPAPGVVLGDGALGRKEALGVARQCLGRAAHLEHLAIVHSATAVRAAQTAALPSDAGAGRLPVGQSLRTLQRTIQRAADVGALARSTPPSGQAMAVFVILKRRLSEARVEIIALEAVADPGTNTEAQTPGEPVLRTAQQVPP